MLVENQFFKSQMEEENKTDNRNCNGFSDWEHLQVSSPPATTIPISDDPFLSIFPPVNHEGLPATSLLDTSNESAASTASSCPGDTSKLYSHSPTPISPLARWIVCALQVLNSKALSFLSGFRSRVVLFWLQSESSGCVGGITTVASLVMVGVWMWWRRRPRRRRGSTDDSIERLNVLIKEKDEKIIELLNQVAQLNKLLLARYRVPVLRDC